MTSSIVGRRHRIETVANADAARDMLVGFTGEIGPVRVALHYVPDRLLLTEAGFLGWLDALAAETWPSPERLGIAALDDLNDVLVPRWLELLLHHGHHSVLVEDRQPDWQNAMLLAGLRGAPGGSRPG